ncbi:MAG: 2-oxo acid dehydrogenase subunit E2 [Proteobacteria bacterium]|nr:2-oxo acid dehydrogenase subunit E2 [Pseudomonadota bacterium]
MAKRIAVPDLGDFKDVAVVDVMVEVGDVLELETPLATLETEKATMDVPATIAGRVTNVMIRKGDRVSTGSPVVEVEPLPAATDVDPTIRHPSLSAPAAAAAPAPPAAAPTSPAPTSTPIPAPVQAPAPAPVAPPVAAAPSPKASAAPAAPSQLTAGQAPVEDIGFARTHASPSVRLLARELGVDLTRVTGTGPKGRITHENVKEWVKRALTTPAAAGATGGALPRVPEVDFAKFGPVDVQPLTRIQKISGPRLHASWVNLPHVTQFDEADITALEDVRGKLKQKALDEGIKLTPLAFILRACAKVLQQFPRFNASLDARGENLVYKKYLHLGFAADTPNGLVVPVLKDADRKDVYELARELANLSEKARAGKLSAADMQGGCFTVSSLGGIGGTAFTPIINAPEVAILGVSRSSMKPVYVDGQFVPRLMLPLSLSYDHRVIDGAEAARFTTALAAALADARGLVEAVP